jgi:hypothetical protein
MDHATVINTPEGIERYRLIALRGAVKLESVGLRRRGRSAKAIAADLLGVSVRSSHDRIMYLLTVRINAN